MSSEADRLLIASRLEWTPQRSSPCPNSHHPVSVKVALKESTARRLSLIRSPLGGGLVPSADNPSSDGTPDLMVSSAATQQQQQHYMTHGNTNGSSTSNNSLGESNGSTLQDFSGPAGSNRVDYLSSAIRFKKQKDIAHIVPVTDTKRMTREHWEDLYSLERRYLPVDWSKSKESPILGVKQSHINRDHRHRIVKWMGEACGLFKWTTQTFFTAVHAWDTYITTVPHEVTTAELAKLSAACLYYGAQLVESAADENVKPLEEFAELCPEVGSTAAVREIQAHLVDTLQGISSVRRTPVDFLLLFLAQLQIAPSPCPELFESLLHQNLLDVLWDIIVAVTLTIYANGLALDGLPGSRWVAGSMLRMLEYACPALRTDTHAREIIRKHVFHLPLGSLEEHRVTVLDPIVKSVWQLILETAAHGADRKTTVGSGLRQGLIQGSKMIGSYRTTAAPYDIMRHHLPLAFPQWPITFPNNKIVQDVSARLRAASLETCTPPNVYATGLSISASKRVGEKPRRQQQPGSSFHSTGDHPVGGSCRNKDRIDEENAAIAGRRSATSVPNVTSASRQLKGEQVKRT